MPNVTSYTTGPRGTNSFIDPNSTINATTPYIDGLVNGAALDGLVDATITPADLKTDGLTVPGNALLAIERIDLSQDNTLAAAYSGFDLIVVDNLTGINLANPQIGIVTVGSGSTYETGLQSGGAVAAAQTLTALNAGAIWVTLVPQ